MHTLEKKAAFATLKLYGESFTNEDLYKYNAREYNL